MTKTKNYLNEFRHNVIQGKKKVLTFLDFLKNTHPSDLVPDTELTLSQQFQTWLTDIFVYGALLSIIYNFFIEFVGFHNLYLWFILGISRWIIFDSVKEFRERLR